MVSCERGRQMGYERASEFVAVGLLALSLVLNAVVMVAAGVQLRQRSSLGLRMVLVVAAFDLLGPVVGLAQEALSVATDSNILQDSQTCQVLGAVHSAFPVISTTLVALLSLERSLCIYGRPLYARTFVCMGIVASAPVALLSFLVAYGDGFALAPSRLFCFVSPRAGPVAFSYYCTAVAMLVVNGIVIACAYTSIIRLRFSAALQPTSSKPIPLRHYNAFVARAAITIACYAGLIIPCVCLLVYEASSGHPLPRALSSALATLVLALSLVNPLLLLLLHTSISHTLLRLVYHRV